MLMAIFLKSVLITNFAYSNNNKNINLNSTSSLTKLLETKINYRDSAWHNKCNAAIWKTCFVKHEITHTVAQDNCPYIQLRTPINHTQISEPITFSEAIQAATEQGHGLMLYAGNDENPAWALTFGDILQLANKDQLPEKNGHSARRFYGIN